MDFYVLGSCVAAAAGGAAALPIAARLLGRKKRSFDVWWDESFEGWKAFRAENERDPKSKASGHEGALGVWVRAQRDDAARGALTESRMKRLEDAGFEFEGRAEAVPDAKFDYELDWKPDACAYLALASLVIWMVVVWLSGIRGFWALIVGVAFGVAVLTGVAMAACDVKARVIPWECCAAMAATGAVLAFLENGLSGLAWTVGAAVVVGAALWVLGNFFKLTGREAMGGGDLRAAPAAIMLAGVAPHVALASGAVWGGLIAAAGLIAWLVVELARGKVALHGNIPLGPFFSAWAATGIIATLFV